MQSPSIGQAAQPRFTLAERPGDQALAAARTLTVEPEVRSAQIADLQARARFDTANSVRVPSTTITVQRGDTLESLASRYGTTIDQLARLNPDVRNLDDLRAGATLKVPTNPQVVQVQPGDTLAAMAERYGVTVNQLASANGITNPNAMQAGQRIAIVPANPTGLDSNAQVRAYIDAMQELKADWPKLTPAERLDRLSASINDRLQAQGIPPIMLAPDASGNASGVYDFSTHSIGIDSGLLSQKAVSDDQLRGLANTLYHEGRHAEQWFNMARVQIAAGQDPADIGLPQNVLDAAAAAPRLDPKSTEGKFFGAMYESVYGAGGADRNETLGKLNGGDYSVYEDYRALPEEADAWRVGGKVENLWPRS